MNYKKRIDALQTLFSREKIDSLFVTNSSNLFYLTGFKGVSPNEREVTALIDKSGLTLFSPRLYQKETRKLAKKHGFKVKILNERVSLFSYPAEKFTSGKIVGVEADDLKLSEYKNLNKNSKSKLKFTEGLVENLRTIKSDKEIELVKQAVKITDKIFAHIKREIQVGVSEKAIARRIVELAEDFGADRPAFEPIVASGVNSALPHYVTTNKMIKRGILLIDAGISYKGYNSDLTRTFYIGKPDEKFINKYNFLLGVQEKIIKKIRPGVKAQDIWRFTLDLLGNEAKYFTHSVGHGIGIDVHETPYLRNGMKQTLKKNQLVTIEPGLYFSGWGGIRLEDYLQITKGSNNILSKSPKRLQDIIIET